MIKSGDLVQREKAQAELFLTIKVHFPHLLGDLALGAGRFAQEMDPKHWGVVWESYRALEAELDDPTTRSGKRRLSHRSDARRRTSLPGPPGEFFTRLWDWQERHHLEPSWCTMHATQTVDVWIGDDSAYQERKVDLHYTNAGHLFEPDHVIKLDFSNPFACGDDSMWWLGEESRRSARDRMIKHARRAISDYLREVMKEATKRGFREIREPEYLLGLAKYQLDASSTFRSVADWLMDKSTANDCESAAHVVRRKRSAVPDDEAVRKGVRAMARFIRLPLRKRRHARKP
jgi:hypothetical protein